MGRVNIHGHTILTKLKISGKAFDSQIAWVRGYILALEDTLGDLETLLQSMRYGYGADARTALEAAVEQVTETLTQSRATLAALEQMEQNHIDHVQRPEETEDALQPTQARQDQAQAT